MTSATAGKSSFDRAPWLFSNGTTTCAVLACHQALYAPGLILITAPAQRQAQELFIKVRDTYRELSNVPRVVSESAMRMDYIAEIMRRDPLVRLRPSVLVDYTGVGRPVFDMFRERPALRLAQGIAITSGREVIPNSVGWSVPKVELVSKLQALLHSGNLKIHMGLSNAPVLVRELNDFRVKYSDAGNATFNAREDAHDDPVLALALAVFGLSRPEYATADDVKVTFAWRGP